MKNLTEVVKTLLIINVIMFFGTNMLSTEMKYSLMLYFPASQFFQPFQLVTHMFMHGSMGHLFFNMFALYMFGPPLEALWGPKKFLFYYLFTGFGALALHLGVTYIELQSGSIPASAINIPMLGASGAVFGLLAGFGMKYPNTVLQLLLPPIPIKAKYFVLIYAGLELFLGLSGVQPGVAHFAHLGGALFGFLIIRYWIKTGK